MVRWKRRRWSTVAIVVAAFASFYGFHLFERYRYDLPMWWPERLGRPDASDLIFPGPAPRDQASGCGPQEPLAALGGDGLRACIAPSFSSERYLVEIAPDGLRLPGSPNVRYRITRDGKPVEDHRLVANWEDVSNVLESFDARAQRWQGTTVRTTDGTSIVAERLLGDRITHGESNASAGGNPLNPMANLGPELSRLLLAYGPTGRVPRLSGWFVSLPDHAEWPCQGGDYNLADHDGIGVGADACARSRQRQPR